MRRQPLISFTNLIKNPWKQAKVCEETKRNHRNWPRTANGFSGDERRRTNSDEKDQRQTEQSARKDFQEDCELSSSFISSLLAVVGATRSKWRQTHRNGMRWWRMNVSWQQLTVASTVSVCSLAAERRDKRSKSSSEIRDYSPKTQLLLLSDMF